jgi:hypothetical protein
MASLGGSDGLSLFHTTLFREKKAIEVEFAYRYKNNNKVP